MAATTSAMGAAMDYLTDSPVVARSYCPGCEPDADPVREILDVRWCDGHAPARDGSDDVAVASDIYLSGSAEAGGDVNRRWCALFHAERTPRPRATRPRRRRRSTSATMQESAAATIASALRLVAAPSERRE
jgi:hypothetical protein